MLNSMKEFFIQSIHKNCQFQTKPFYSNQFISYFKFVTYTNMTKHIQYIYNVASIKKKLG